MSASGVATRTLLCLLALSAPLPGQRAERDAAKPVAIPGAERDKLNALLPAPPEFFGKPGAPARYYSTDLYHYLDGGADAYLDYGLVAMIHREFKAGDVDLTVDIYDMGDPLQAFGIYSAERSPDYLFIPIGAEAHVDVGSLGFLQARYYVKLSAFGDGNRTPTVLEKAARSIEARIGPVGKLPQPVTWFPVAGQVAASQKYIVKAPLGRDYLAPATTAAYRFDSSRHHRAGVARAHHGGGRPPAGQTEGGFRALGRGGCGGGLARRGLAKRQRLGRRSRLLRARMLRGGGAGSAGRCGRIPEGTLLRSQGLIEMQLSRRQFVTFAAGAATMARGAGAPAMAVAHYKQRGHRAGRHRGGSPAAHARRHRRPGRHGALRVQGQRGLGEAQHRLGPPGRNRRQHPIPTWWPPSSNCATRRARGR